MNHYERYDYKSDSQIIFSKFSPYSNQFISFNQHNLLLWSKQNFKPIQTIKNDTQVSCFEFGNSDNTILQGTKQGKIVILSLEKQINQERQANHKESVTILTNYDVNTFMSGSLDTVIMIHDLRQNLPIAQIQQHKKAISDIVTDQDSFRFICSSVDATISLWDFRNYSQFQVLLNNQDSVSNLLLVKNTNALFTSDEKSTIKLWDINEQSQNQVSQFEQPILKMAFDYQKEVLICASQNNLDLLNIQLLHLNTIEMSNVQDIKFEQDFVQVLQEGGDTLFLHQFQLQLDIQQTENNQIPFPQSIQFHQCFYPSQPKEDLNQSQEVSDNIITSENFSLKFSQLLYTKCNQEKYNQLEIIQEISNNHVIISFTLNERISKLQSIIILYTKNEIKKCIQLLCQSDDCSVFIDFFSFLKLDAQKRKLQMKDIALLLEIVNKLLNSKYSYYISQGLEFIKFCFDQVRENRIQYKNEKQSLQKKPVDKQFQQQEVFKKLKLQFEKLINLPIIYQALKGKDVKLANLTLQIKTEISQFLNKLE